MMMRRLLLGSVIAAASLAPCATMAQQAGGLLSFGVGVTDLHWQGTPNDVLFSGKAAEVLASGSYDFTPTLGVQGDLRYEYGSFEPDDPSFTSFTYDAQIFDAALHLFYREKDRFLIGGFAQVGKTTRAERVGEYVDNRYYGGGEAQGYFGNLTVYGQAGGLAYRRDYTNYIVDGWFATLKARYFLTEDFRVDAHLGVEVEGQFDPEDQTYFDANLRTTWNFGLGAEYKFQDTPFSIFAKYDFFDTAYEDREFVRDRQRLLVGVRVQFDDGTLLDRDRSGPPLDPVEPHAVLPVTSD